MPRTTLTETEIALIQRQRVARLATADENGSPTLVPICYAFDGNYFYTPLDEKPKRVQGSQLRRVKNIQARHEASLLLDHYSEDWSELWYLQIYGYADIMPPEHPQHAHIVELLRERYVQYQSMALEQASIITLQPGRINAWGPALH
ncbi:MAG TPA: TIGR03668 family PPOX class F420-dependent oxidoreductase [Dictyobacter sp.]|jgi:PPOX class probable F420-dependent enzyme|nr:TIGR03668 family PPOX class F420-dependent oxidoreductase [Dictyobacter sp.]